jgi:tripartite-type tricarboxylate transporter receptor subunit TctC
MKQQFGNSVVCALVALVSSGALAQAFPGKPIRMVVPFPPGGATDTFARMAAADMNKSLGQQVLVENRPGAGTTIASEIVAKSPADGYTLLYTDLSTHTITTSLYSKLAYHPMRDFAAVAMVNASPLLLVSHPSVPATNVRELVALAKRNPGITLGNSGVGTVTHMTAEKFRQRAGIEVTAVSYKGGNTPIIALRSGEVSLVMATVPASIQHVRDGKIVALGLAAARRSPHLPDVPAIAETIKGVEGAVIAGVLAPAGTPQSVISTLHAEFAKSSATPRAKELFASNAAESLSATPAEIRKAMEQDVREWAAVVQATGVKNQ